METFFALINNGAVFIGAISGILGCLCKMWLFVNKVSNGQKAILRDRIIQMYNFHVDRGHMRIHDHDNLIALYEAYRAIGGNGTVAKLIEELKKLPHLPADGS